VGLTPSPTLRDRLTGFGLLRWFDGWSFSDETGWFKPAPAAFLPALEALDVSDPTAAAHVGDNRRTDVAGALALGMTAVRYTGLDRKRTPLNSTLCPSTTLFRSEALDVSDPTAAAHVGDNRRTDVAGALALGMTAVRYTG